MDEYFHFNSLILAVSAFHLNSYYLCLTSRLKGFFFTEILLRKVSSCIWLSNGKWEYLYSLQRISVNCITTLTVSNFIFYTNSNSL